MTTERPLSSYPRCLGCDEPLRDWYGAADEVGPAGAAALIENARRFRGRLLCTNCALAYRLRVAT